MLRIDTRSRHSHYCFDQTSMGLMARIVAGVGVLLGLMSVAVGGEARHDQWLEYKNNVRCDPNLVVYYDFERGEGAKLENKAVGPGGETDYSPSDLDGKLEGNLTWKATAPGRWQGKTALSFNGVCDYVDCGKVPQLDLGAHDWTILFWIKTTERSRANPFFTKTRPLLWEKLATVIYLEPTGEMYLHQCSAANLVSEEQFNDGIWHQVGATFIDATDQATLIADGKWIKTGKFPATADSPGHHIFIGAMDDARHFIGTIDEVAIYDRALTADEIRNHYEMGKTSHRELAEAAFAEMRKLLADLEAQRLKEQEPAAAEELKRQLDEYREKLAGLKSRSEGQLDTPTWTRLDTELQALIEQLRKSVVGAKLTALLKEI